MENAGFGLRNTSAGKCIVYCASRFDSPPVWIRTVRSEQLVRFGGRPREPQDQTPRRGKYLGPTSPSQPQEKSTSIRPVRERSRRQIFSLSGSRASAIILSSLSPKIFRHPPAHVIYTACSPAPLSLVARSHPSRHHHRSNPIIQPSTAAVSHSSARDREGGREGGSSSFQHHRARPRYNLKRRACLAAGVARRKHDEREAGEVLLRRARRPAGRVPRRDTRRVPPPRHEVAPGQGRPRPRGSGGGQGQVSADTRGVPGAVGREEAGALRRRDVRPSRRRRPGRGRGVPQLPPGDALAHGNRAKRGAGVQPGRAPVHA